MEGDEALRPADRETDDRAVFFRYLWLAALGVVSFTYLFAATQLAGLSPKLRDVAIYALMGMVAPPLCGILLIPRYATARIAAPTMLFAATALAMLVAIQGLVSFAPDPKAAWVSCAYGLMLALPLVHFVVICIWSTRHSVSNSSIVGTLIPGAFVLVASVAVVTLFWFDPEKKAWNGYVALLRSKPFSEAGITFVALSLVAAIVFLGVVVLAAWLDQSMLRYPRRQAVLGSFLLAASILVAGGMSFDFSLALDPFHYLTNVGPAMMVRHGGTPLVDAYSQYGPAPVILTFLAYEVGPRTLSTAQILVQLCNIAFYSLWLICLYRMTRLKMAALVLGLLAIALQLATWDFGNGNVNVAPSILGLRYLPSILLVLALSAMPEGRHQNWLSSLAVLIAAAWSIETLISTLAVLLGYLVAINLRNRTVGRFFTDTLFVALLVILSLSLFSAATWWRSGEAPSFLTYARFLAIYNPVSDIWSIDASSQFFGWIVPLGAVFVVVGETTRRMVLGSAGTVENCNGSDPLFYRFLPMSLLAMQMGAYFAFRSHDYTVATTLLPTLAVIIPAGLTLSVRSVRSERPDRWFLAVQAVLLVICTTFAFVALGRPGAAYSFYLQECRDKDRCRLGTLFETLGQKTQLRDLLERTGNPLSDRYIDAMKPVGLLNDAVEAAGVYSEDKTSVTFLLGDLIGADLATLYVDRRSHFPISFSYTDQLVPELADSIFGKADFTGENGGIVVVRSDLNLTPFEARMWSTIRNSASLCEIDIASSAIKVYRVFPPLVASLSEDISACETGSSSPATR